MVRVLLHVQVICPAGSYSAGQEADLDDATARGLVAAGKASLLAAEKAPEDAADDVREAVEEGPVERAVSKGAKRRRLLRNG